MNQNYSNLPTLVLPFYINAVFSKEPRRNALASVEDSLIILFVSRRHFYRSSAAEATFLYLKCIASEHPFFLCYEKPSFPCVLVQMESKTIQNGVSGCFNDFQSPCMYV